MKEELKDVEMNGHTIGGDELPFDVEETEKEKKPVNLRIQKFLMLSAKVFNYTQKSTKQEKQAASLLFLDASDCDPVTGQPNVVGKVPVLSAFVSEPNVRITALKDSKVFEPVFVKMSGSDGFIKVHDILTDEQVNVYRSVMGDLL